MLKYKNKNADLDREAVKILHIRESNMDELKQAILIAGTIISGVTTIIVTVKLVIKNKTITAEQTITYAILGGAGAAAFVAAFIIAGM